MCALLSVVALLTGLLFATFVVCHASKQGSNTTVCYGEHSQTIIGGDKEKIDLSFDCSSCVEPEFCSEGRDLCFWLSSNKVHVFKNGILSQPSLNIPSGCDPLRIVEKERGFDYIVQCASREPQYKPAQFLTYLSYDDDTVFEAEEELTTLNNVLPNGQSYAELPDNTVIIARDGREYTISLLANSDQLAVVHGNTRFLTVTGCEANHRLHAGPIVDSTLQVLVDCTTTDGSLIRQRVFIPMDDIFSSPTIETLPSPLSNDTVRFSSASSYILYRGTSRLLFIKSSQISGTPGILTFDGPIGQIAFLGENQLLVSLPGENRRIVDISLFFLSSFNAMLSVRELENSVAHCPQGMCPPIVLAGSKLYLLSNDPSEQFYSILSSFNVDNLSIEPNPIAKTRRTNIFSTCFLTFANISMLSSQHPTTPPKFPTAPYPMTTNTPTDPIMEEPGSEVATQQLLSNDAIIGISVAAFVAVVFLAVCLALLCYLARRNHLKSSSSSTLQKYPNNRQETGLPLNSCLYLLPGTSRPRTQGGSAGTSTTVSTTASLEILPHAQKETVDSHYPAGKKVAPTEMITGFEQK